MDGSVKFGFISRYVDHWKNELDLCFCFVRNFHPGSFHVKIIKYGDPKSMQTIFQRKKKKSLFRIKYALCLLGTISDKEFKETDLYLSNVPYGQRKSSGGVCQLFSISITDKFSNGTIYTKNIGQHCVVKSYRITLLDCNWERLLYGNAWFFTTAFNLSLNFLPITELLIILGLAVFFAYIKTFPVASSVWHLGIYCGQ